MELNVTANSTDQALHQRTRSAARTQPVFWKRWAVSMLAVYPPLVILVFASQYVLSEVPLLVSLFVIAFCLTGLSTGLILPFLNRQLRDWLFR